MKKVKNWVRFLVDNGLIAEINKKVLHPIGLTMEVGIHPDNRRRLAIDGIFEVEDDDDEGFLYDEETLEYNSKKFDAYIRPQKKSLIKSRKEKIGFVVQGKDFYKENEDG